MSGDSPDESEFSLVQPTVEEEEEEIKIEFKDEVPELDSEDNPVISRESLFDAVATKNQVLPSSSQSGPMPDQGSMNNPPPQASNQNQSVPQQTTTSGTQGTQLQPVSTTVIKQKLGGEEIEFDTAGASGAKLAPAFYSKTECENLTPDKRADLYGKATQSRLTMKFDLVSSTFSDEDKLNDTFNIGILVNKFNNHLVKYDMFDVFNIVYLQPNDPKMPIGNTRDLTENYSKI
jgi:hypothetical protein